MQPHTTITCKDRHSPPSLTSYSLYDQQKLQAYILLCQDKNGGIFDKPGKYADLYHTCYSLSGLSSAQRSADNKEDMTFKHLTESSSTR